MRLDVRRDAGGAGIVFTGENGRGGKRWPAEGLWGQAVVIEADGEFA